MKQGVKRCIEAGFADMDEVESDNEEESIPSLFFETTESSSGWIDIEASTVPPVSLNNIHQDFITKRLRGMMSQHKKDIEYFMQGMYRHFLLMLSPPTALFELLLCQVNDKIRHISRW